MIVVGAPAANFSSTNAYLVSGESVDFMDESNGDPISWEWTFESGTPATSTDENPTGIEYTAQGAYDVTLTVENEYGIDMIVKDDYVVVDGPFADFEADITNIVSGESITFTDISINNPTSWNWKFFGGSPGSHIGQTPPPITYNGTGDYNIKLTVGNDLGNNFITKENYIHVGTIGLDEFDAEKEVNVFPNPTQGSFTLELGQAGITGALVDVINAKGEIVYHYELTDAKDKLAIDIQDNPAGIYMLRIHTNEMNINRKITLVK